MSSEEDSDAFEQFLEDQNKKVDKRYVYEDEFRKIEDNDDFVIYSSEESNAESDVFSQTSDEEDDNVINNVEKVKWKKNILCSDSCEGETIKQQSTPEKGKKKPPTSSKEEANDDENSEILSKRKIEKSSITKSLLSDDDDDISNIKPKKKKINVFAFKANLKLPVITGGPPSDNCYSPIFSDFSSSDGSFLSDAEDNFITPIKVPNLMSSNTIVKNKINDVKPKNKTLKEINNTVKNSFITPKVSKILPSDSKTMSKTKTTKVSPLNENKVFITPLLKISKKIAQSVPNKILKRNQITLLQTGASSYNSDVGNDNVFTDSEDEQKYSSYTPLSKLKTSMSRVKELGEFKERRRFDFISSLMNNVDDDLRDPEALRYRKNFSKLKEKLSRKIYRIYNEHVFLDELPSNVEIKWHKRLRTTAGLCCLHRDGTIHIELSVHVLTDTERLLTTLMHEMCHGAVWVVNKSSNHHGPIWRLWASEANRIFPNVPLALRCHNYDILSKYEYWCLTCNQVIKRHSKSLDDTNQVCGRCKGKFTLFVNLPNGEKKVYIENLSLTGFQKFVKDNYKIYRVGGTSHAEVMKILSKKYALSKEENDLNNILKTLTLT